MQLRLNGAEKKPGVDYLIEPGSPGIKGSFATVSLSASDMLDQLLLINKLQRSAGKFIVVSPFNKKDFSSDQQKVIADVVQFLRFSADNPAAGTIILTKEKLTWTGATTLYARPSFTVSNDSTQKTIETVEVEVENKFYKQYTSQNVVGYIEGDNSDSLLVMVAHYDHLGMMGAETIFPGANDNASGVAMLLGLARYYKAHKPKYNTVFIAFSGEELGLLGAKYFTENPLFKLSKIKFLMNFDIAGTGDEGIQVVNGKVYQEKFDRLIKINTEQKLLPQIKIRGEACNSDHCMFHAKKVPCFFIYTLGGIQAYHDVYDRYETLPFTEFTDYFTLVTQFVDGL